MDDRCFDWWRRRDVIEDPLTDLALDDAVVLTDLLEHRWPQADVTDRTETFARRGAERHAFAFLGHLVKEID